MEKLEQLVKRAEGLANELSELRKEIAEEKLRIVKETYGIDVGSVVTHKGQEYRIAEIQPGQYGKPWLYGNPRKKDGTFGTAVRNLFSDWEVKE
jgi:hypothetical protein